MARPKLKAAEQHTAEVTLEDVARRADVSPMTVSRAIRRPGLVRRETFQRIQTAIEELNYRPNKAASSLAGRKAHAFGVVVPPGSSNFSYFFMQVLAGLEEVFYDLNVDLLIRVDRENAGAEYESMVRSRTLDGFLFLAPGEENRNLSWLRTKPSIPVVIVSGNNQPGAFASVKVNNHQGIELAIRHLLDLGHRRIAHLAGFDGVDHVDSNERRAAFMALLREAGLGVPPSYIQYGEFTVADGATAFGRLASLPEPPTAVVAGNDLMAIGALKEAAARGIRVPRDMSIVGFDDIELAGMVVPALTTVAQPMRELGRVAARLIVDIASRPPKKKHDSCDEKVIRVLNTELVHRGSSAPPPAKHQSKSRKE